jgi:hypothetical protein
MNGCDRLGFKFSRHKLRGGRNALEFYLNLYQKPDRVVPEESLDQWRKYDYICRGSELL